MKIKNLLCSLLVLSLSFTACTDEEDNTPVNPNEQPSENPGDNTEQNPEEQPTPDIVLTAVDFVGEYYGDAYTQYAGAYTLILTADGLVEGGGMLPNSTYYVLDTYGDFVDSNNTDTITFPVGTYTFDTTNSCAKGTIGHAYSSYITSDEFAEGTASPFESAELVVTTEGATLTAVVGGVKHIISFEGQATILDKRAADREFNAPNSWCFFYGDHDSKGVADSYLLFLSDDTEYNLMPNKTYYRLDLFSEIVDKSNGYAIPHGTYIVDEEASRKPFTLSVGVDSDYVKLDKNGKYADIGSISAGKVVVDDNGITAELHIMGGVHTVTYSGYIPISDYSGSYFE